jgi:hypothetical protein
LFCGVAGFSSSLEHELRINKTKVRATMIIKLEYFIMINPKVRSSGSPFTPPVPAQEFQGDPDLQIRFDYFDGFDGGLLVLPPPDGLPVVLGLPPGPLPPPPLPPPLPHLPIVYSFSDCNPRIYAACAANDPPEAGGLD